MTDHTLLSPSNETALCLIPPQEQWSTVDSLRFCNDRSYGRWPPHVNLIYPFVHSGFLEKGSLAFLQDACQRITATPANRRLCLDSAGCFTHQRHSTIFLEDGTPARTDWLRCLRSEILSLLGRGSDSSYRPHMTVGQCDEAEGSDRHSFLLEKARLIPALSWEIASLAILRRNSHGRMVPWATIDLMSQRIDLECSSGAVEYDLAGGPDALLRPAFTYSQEQMLWRFPDHSILSVPGSSLPDHLVVASYNVLAEFTWPPTRSRHTLLVQTLSNLNASADILVLQEVTDDFLPILLANKIIQEQYPYTSHAPPTQVDAGPLPRHLNVVILSKHRFSWQYLPSNRAHKGTCLAVFDELGFRGASGGKQHIVVAAIHLTQGLTDGAVSAKQGEMQKVLRHLKEEYPESMWLVAGDFNMASSSYTIAMARQSRSISDHTMGILARFEAMLSETGFVDAWIASRLEMGESSDDAKMLRDPGQVFEGEQGATFDPQQNHLAAQSVGSGQNQRPQRYDRILVKGAGVMRPAGFSMFGFDPNPAGSPSLSTNLPRLASDHYGIRCLLRKYTDSTSEGGVAGLPFMPIHPRLSGGALGQPLALRDFLIQMSILPTKEEKEGRARALALLREVVLDHTSEGATRPSPGNPIAVLTPVGSYGLGVWTRQSDLDCLCIGSTSSAIFFRVAKKRLRKASSRGIRLLRTVNAASGTMIELEIHGVKADLHYCHAPTIAQLWPDVMKRPSSDAAFSLRFEALAKLKPVRDVAYLRRSIPDLAPYRLAHYLIRAWASERGIYGARFGYLGGIHISVLLVPVCKTLTQQAAITGNGPVSAADIVLTFFSHYANFSWESNAVFDPFFHKPLRYHRTSREPLCLLGWHSPALNTASSASKSTTRTLKMELERANTLLSDPAMSWCSFLGGYGSEEGALSSGAVDFLKAHKLFIKLSIHYWGPSIEIGARLLGWLESRFVSLLVDIGLKVEGLIARIWPQRFATESLEEKESNNSDMYQGFYLIGIDGDDSNITPQLPEDVKPALFNLRAVLQHFERRILADEKYFDPGTSWFHASLAQRGELGQLSRDRRDWGRQIEDDESDEEVDDESDESDESGECGGSPAEARLGRSTTGNRTARERDGSSAGKKLGPGVKLRTALDVLNRLRWDPSLDRNDYVVGYLDRFDGIQEKAASAWKTEQTDEEFIPQHRIAYFKKKSTNQVEWDRSKRIDMIFR